MLCDKHITDKNRINSKAKKFGWRQRQGVDTVPQTKQEQQQEETKRGGRILFSASIRVMSDDVLIWDFLPTNIWCLQFRKVYGIFHEEAFKINNWTEFIFSGGGEKRVNTEDEREGQNNSMDLYYLNSWGVSKV